MDETEESPIKRRRNARASMTDRLQLGFALLLFPILYILVIYSLLTFVWSATISPLRINQLLFPRLVTSSHAADGKESPWYLLITDVALLVLFAAFHTGMASRVYKRLLHQFHMVPFIRASYILVTCTLIQVVAVFWRCTPNYYAWRFDDSPLMAYIMMVIHSLAWLQMLCSLFHLDHLELFGIKQLYYMLWLSQNEPIKFKAIEQQQLFNNARHPLLLGPLIVLWLVPCMPADRMIVAILLPLYQIWGNRVTHEDVKYVKTQFQKKVTELRTETVIHQ